MFNSGVGGCAEEAAAMAAAVRGGALHLLLVFPCFSFLRQLVHLPQQALVVFFRPRFFFSVGVDMPGRGVEEKTRNKGA